MTNIYIYIYVFPLTIILDSKLQHDTDILYMLYDFFTYQFNYENIINSLF